MKSGLNQVTLKSTPCDEFISAAGDAKFDGVEVNQENIATYLTQGTYKTLKDILESYQLSVASVDILEDFNLCSDYDFKTKILSLTQLMCEIGYKLESDLIIVNPSFIREDADPAEIREDKIITRTQKRLSEISKIAAKNDIRVGFEFLALSHSSVRSLSLSRKIIDPIALKLENVGYIVDSFHYLISGGNEYDLMSISNLYLIHVSDLRFTSGEDLSGKKDTDRVFPGEGNFDFPGFIRMLKKRRYRGYLSIELFDPELYKKVPFEVAKKARDCFDNVPL
ncbi:MAG: isomerase [Promethearchaeota archaeon CR_4]|nr:MAG: isomerase [Candidatus Lokiarchaeota archaeon CR_4]